MTIQEEKDWLERYKRLGATPEEVESHLLQMLEIYINGTNELIKTIEIISKQLP